jgi:hypothetical protein
MSDLSAANIALSGNITAHTGVFDSLMTETMNITDINNSYLFDINNDELRLQNGNIEIMSMY